MTARAPMRTVTERIGRHAVRLSCGHVEVLSAGEADAIGRKLPCERCVAARTDEREADDDAESGRC